MQGEYDGGSVLTLTQHVSQSLGIRSIPTFHFYLGDTLVFTQKGADKNKLQDSVKKLMESENDVLEKIAGEGEAEDPEETFTEGDLQVLHDLKRCECLNDLPGNSRSLMTNSTRKAFYQPI